MTAMDELTAFIEARLDEDEAQLGAEPWVRRDLRGRRAVLAGHRPVTHVPVPFCVAGIAPGDDPLEPPVAARWPCGDVRELAATWSDHGDYRAEWAPGHHEPS